MSCSRHSCRGWGCVRARVYTILETLHVASLRGRFFFNVVISFWDSFSLNVHHQYTVHSNNLLPWFLSWMWKYWLLVSFWVTGGLGRVTARCGGRDIFCNGEIFYFTIFLSPAFSGLLGDSGTKKERGGGERGRRDGRVSSSLGTSLGSTSDKCISFNPTTVALTISVSLPSTKSPSFFPFVPFTRHKFDWTFRIINKAGRSSSSSIHNENSSSWLFLLLIRFVARIQILFSSDFHFKYSISSFSSDSLVWFFTGRSGQLIDKKL